MYQMTVKRIGTDAKVFKKEKIIILFGNHAPSELAEFCYIIDVISVEGEITNEHVLKLDEVSYQITGVGSAVRRNLTDLGHITLKFDGSTNVEQPGTLYLEDKEIVDIKPESTIAIEK